jgi:hypothetical protein
MAEITIINEPGPWKSHLYIGDDFQKGVRGFSIEWGFGNEFPILKVDRLILVGDRPIVAYPDADHVKETTEYYPIHSLKILNR